MIYQINLNTLLIPTSTKQHRSIDYSNMDEIHALAKSLNDEDVIKINNNVYNAEEAMEVCTIIPQATLYCKDFSQPSKQTAVSYALRKCFPFTTTAISQNCTNDKIIGKLSQHFENHDKNSIIESVILRPTHFCNLLSTDLLTNSSVMQQTLAEWMKLEIKFRNTFNRGTQLSTKNQNRLSSILSGIFNQYNSKKHNYFYSLIGKACHQAPRTTMLFLRATQKLVSFLKACIRLKHRIISKSRNSREFCDTKLIARYKFQDNNPVLVDVGGHHGNVSRVFAQRGWNVIAFEPEKNNRAAFLKNLEEYENVMCIPLAVSDKDDQIVPFYVSNKHYGIHGLAPFHDTHSHAYDVKTTKIDTIINKYKVPNVTLLKVDTEGADFLALQGFNFEKIKPEMITIEIMDQRSKEHYGYNHHDVVAYMKQFGYAAYISEMSELEEYAEEGKGSTLSWIRCQKYPLDKDPACGNIFFTQQRHEKKFIRTLNNYLLSIKLSQLLHRAITIPVRIIKMIKQIFTLPIYLLRKIKRTITRKRNHVRFQRLAGSGPINIIDVGSAKGIGSPFFERPDCLGKTLNFEPRDAIEITKHSITYNAALWSEDETKDFYVYKGRKGSGSSLLEQNIEYVKENFEELKKLGNRELAETWFDRSELVKTIPVKCKKLDNVLKDLDTKEKYHFIKIDAQGAESHILKGGEEFLKNQCEAIYIELLKIPLYKGAKLIDEVTKQLYEHGFDLARKDKPHGTFDSQHNCLFIKRNKETKTLNLIKELYGIE